jgi:hypothetical protein
VAQLVVDLAGDVDAFLLANRLQVRGERPQVLLGAAQPLLGQRALGELRGEHAVHVVQAHEHRELGAHHLGDHGLRDVVDRARLVALEHLGKSSEAAVMTMMGV